MKCKNCLNVIIPEAVGRSLGKETETGRSVRMLEQKLR